MEENIKKDPKSSKQDKSSESETKVNLYKTGKFCVYICSIELCKKFQQYGFCKYGDKCQFAHGPAELRPITRHPKYKTEKCKSFWANGSCRYGARCKFLHNEASKNTPENEEPQQLQPQQNTVQYCFPPQPQQQTQCVQIVSPPPYIEQTPSPNIPIAVQYIDGAIYYPESDYDYNSPVNPSTIAVMRKISAPERAINAYTWDQVRKVSSPSLLTRNDNNSPLPVSYSAPRVAFLPGRKNNIPTEQLMNYIPYSDNEKVNAHVLRKSTWNDEIVYDMNDKENRKSTWPISKTDEDQLNVRFSNLNVQNCKNNNYYENDDNCNNRLPVFTKLSNEHSIYSDAISYCQSNISEISSSSINSTPFE